MQEKSYRKLYDTNSKNAFDCTLYVFCATATYKTN